MEKETKLSTYQVKVKNLQTGDIKPFGEPSECSTDEVAINAFKTVISNTQAVELDRKTHSYTLIKDKTDVIATMP